MDKLHEVSTTPTLLPSVRPGARFLWGGEVVTLERHLGTSKHSADKDRHHADVRRADGSVAMLRGATVLTVVDVLSEEDDLGSATTEDDGGRGADQRSTADAEVRPVQRPVPAHGLVPEALPRDREAEVGEAGVEEVARHGRLRVVRRE